MKIRIHLLMQDAHNNYVLVRFPEEQNVPSGQHGFVACPNMFGGPQGCFAYGSRLTHGLDVPDIFLGLHAAPVFNRVIPDLFQILFGSRRKEQTAQSSVPAPAIEKGVKVKFTRLAGSFAFL